MTIHIFLSVSVALAALVTRGASHPLRNGTIAETEQTQGIHDITPFILGGLNARPGKIPYILSLQYEGRHLCGASLLWDERNKRDYAITAAHCVDDGETRGLKVRGGSLSVTENSNNKQELRIRKIVVHPNYLPQHTEKGNDIAILFLSGNFHHNDYVKPISLPSSIVEPGENVLVSGWGSTASSSSGSDRLQVVKVPIVSNDECAEMYAERYGSDQVIFDSNVCAGDIKGGKDSCKGDSGGPLAVDYTSTGPELIGITSWGYECALPNFPGVYTRVSVYANWIKNILSYN